MGEKSTCKTSFSYHWKTLLNFWLKQPYDCGEIMVFIYKVTQLRSSIICNNIQLSGRKGEHSFR